jgi:hypothetical protein
MTPVYSHARTYREGVWDSVPLLRGETVQSSPDLSGQVCEARGRNVGSVFEVNITGKDVSFRSVKTDNILTSRQTRNLQLG